MRRYPILIGVVLIIAVAVSLIAINALNLPVFKKNAPSTTSTSNTVTSSDKYPIRYLEKNMKIYIDEKLSKYVDEKQVLSSIDKHDIKVLIINADLSLKQIVTSTSRDEYVIYVIPYSKILKSNGIDLKALKGSNKVLLVVDDTGKGIDEEELGKILHIPVPQVSGGEMLPDKIVEHIIGAAVIYWPNNLAQPLVDEPYTAPEINYSPLTHINDIIVTTISILDTSTVDYQ